MKVLVTGVNGQLGYDVLKELNLRSYEAIGVTRKEMDLESTNSIVSCIEKVNPDAIIHCAAYTAVDLAEDNEELCRRINALATRDIALYAKKLDIPMIYISTDYVFDGNKGIEDLDVDEYIDSYGIEKLKSRYIPYTEKDIPNPINVYGKTKLEGERYVQDILDKYYIIRISWVFGENGKNFINTMLSLSNERDELSIIDDQVGSPTYTKELSRLLVDMIDRDKYGIYHVSNQGSCSWYEFAKEIFDITNNNVSLNKISTKMYKTKAKRPLNSLMSKSKLEESGFEVLTNWKDSIKDYILRLDGEVK